MDSQKIIKCAICGKECINNKSLSSHIRYSHNMNSKEYYDKYLKKDKYEGICPVCGEPTEFLRIGSGYRSHCSTRCSSLDKDVQNKLETTMLTKYGVSNGYLLPDAQRKAHENTSSDEALNKRIQTNLSKLGYEFPAQSPDVQKKRENTCIKLYGGVAPIFSDDVKNKIKNTILENYGVEHNWMSPDPKLNGKAFVKNVISEFEARNDCTLANTLAKTYGMGFLKGGIVPFIYDDIYNYKYVKNEYIPDLEFWSSNVGSGLEHSIENEIIKFYSGEIKHRCRTVLPHLEIDLYFPELKLGIECNGDYWHSDRIITDKHYHEMKSKIAENCGIHLIHIYEYEWKNENLRSKIILLLKIAMHSVSNRIYARDCEIKQISNKDAKELNESVHLQGHRNAQVTYGLFYKGTLVQLMSFSKTKYNKNLKTENSWEIIRGCPGSNNLVVGGVSKLFKHFVNDYNPDYVFSYCDFNKFSGVSYEKLGMKFIGYTGPDKSWVLNNGTVVKRNPKKYRDYKENSVAIIWGAGSKKYLWKNPKKDELPK